MNSVGRIPTMAVDQLRASHILGVKFGLKPDVYYRLNTKTSQFEEVPKAKVKKLIARVRRKNKGAGPHSQCGGYQIKFRLHVFPSKGKC
jgi:hypothetical protein